MDANRSRFERAFSSKWLRIAAVLLVSCLFIAVLSGAAVARYVVIIEDGERQTMVYTSTSDPEEILKNEYITLDEQDQYFFGGLQYRFGRITIRRAHTVTVTTMDGVFQTKLCEGSVADALDALHITVDDDDLLNVALSEPVRTDLSVEITRVEYRTVEQESPIPYPTVEQLTPTLKDGRRRTCEEGKEGLLRVTMRQKLINGEVVEETPLKEEVLTEPVPERILVGCSDSWVSQLSAPASLVLDANGNPVHYKQKITGRATAYSALGKPTRFCPGVVAMDLSKFPRGTKLYIKTPDGGFVYGYAEVRDTGTAVCDGTCLVDLFFDSYRESCLFGVKIVDVYVLE